MTRQQKITLGEMRASGVRDLLIYCSDYRCARSTAIDGRTIFGCLILSPCLSAKRAVEGAPISARIGTGNYPGGARVADRGWRLSK
jgi:hypothetical protein